MISRPAFILPLFLATFALAQPTTRPFTPPKDVRFQRANIMSEGTRMSAEIFAPAAAPQEQKLPTIILCHGWGGVAADLRFQAISFAKAGYLAIVFDYRGWGASDGRLMFANPTDQ